MGAATDGSPDRIRPSLPLRAGKQVLRIFMEEARRHGAKPLRDWDKGL